MSLWSNYTSRSYFVPGWMLEGRKHMGSSAGHQFNHRIALFDCSQTSFQCLILKLT